MECARPPSWLTPSPSDFVHGQRTHTSTLPDEIRLILEGADIVLLTASPAAAADLPVLQADISSLKNGTSCRKSHNFSPTRSCRTQTAATNARLARQWIKRINGQHFAPASHNNDSNGDKQSAGSTVSNQGQDRDSSQQRSGSEEAGDGENANDKDRDGADNQGNSATSGGAGGGSNGNDDDGNRDGQRPRRPNTDNNDEEDDSDEEQDGDDSQNEPQATQDSIKADPDGPPDSSKDILSIKQELVAVEDDADTGPSQPASTSTPARRPLPGSAPRSGDSHPRASSATASVPSQTKPPAQHSESSSNPAQATSKPPKKLQTPAQKAPQPSTAQTTSPQARRPQPPLFSESPTSSSPQDSRPQRRPLPQARPVQLGTPLQSPIITIQNVDNNETPHPLPSQAIPRSPHSRSPHRPSPLQLSPHRAGRSPRRPLPHSRGGSRQPLSITKPSPTSVEALRIMPIATGSIEADPTDPCTANDVATFDMYWTYALEELNRNKQKAAEQADGHAAGQASGLQQRERSPLRAPHTNQQALPEPPPNKGSAVPMEVDEQPADTQASDSQTKAKKNQQRQLQPRMQPREQSGKQPQLQPRPQSQSQREEAAPNYQHTERQFIVHVGPGLARPPERRKYCKAFYEGSAEEEAALKKAKEERQKERMLRQAADEEENRRQRLQLHQQRIQQQVLKQQMHEQEVSLRRQQQEQQQRDLEQQEQGQELQRQLAEQSKRQQLWDEERQRQIGDMDYYKRYLGRKPPLQMLSELEEKERLEREQQQKEGRLPQDDMHIDQPFEDRNYRHDDPSRQPVSRTWPLERPGPLLKQHAPLERPGPLLAQSSHDSQSSRPVVPEDTAHSTRSARPVYSRPIRPAHPARSAHTSRPIHIAPASSSSATITQPLQLIATRDGTVMSVDDYRDAHKRAVIEAREHLRRLEEIDSLLPVERPDLIARRGLPPAPPAPAPYAVPTTGDSAIPRTLKKGVTPCPCCNQYLKGYRDEGANAAGEAATHNG